ncbi:hypothetical protein [Paraburkholderia fungorum]|uniref:hypothetical protein n=1 Tax=Paraburkholderia fungorum TaxID=134537 RepID=UPI003F4999F4
MPGTDVCDRAGEPEPVSIGHRHTWLLPSDVVQQKLRDKLAASKIQPRQVGESPEACFLPQRNAIVRVVERIQRGKEGALAAAENTEGVENDRLIGRKRPLVFRVLNGLSGAIPEIDWTGQQDSLFPCVKKPRGRGSKMGVAFLLLAAKLFERFGGGTSIRRS